MAFDKNNSNPSKFSKLWNLEWCNYNIGFRKMEIWKIELMKTILLIILISILILVFIIYLKHFRQLRPKEEGFEFVYVENNGSVRELDNGEMEYLKEKLQH